MLFMGLFSSPLLRGANLASMETLAERSSAPSGFASLLASLAGPKGADAAFDDSDLAPDVASLSYESALRAHARYRVADPDPVPAPPASKAAPRSLSEFLEALPQTAFDNSPERPSPQTCRDSPAQNQALKSASVTVRLSAEESARLRRRAAEAGLTLSAYLRSCTFEVESLRAQVKKALAELRSSETGPQRLPGPVPRPFHAFCEKGGKRQSPIGVAPAARSGKSLLSWVYRLLTRRQPVSRTVRA